MTRDDSTTAVQGVRMSRLLAKFAFVLLAFLAQPAMAATTYAFCSGGTSVGISNLPTSLAVMPGTPAGTPLGSGNFVITVKSTNCTGGSGTGTTFDLAVGVGTALSATTASGINFQAVGPPSFTTSGTCPVPTLTQSTASTRLDFAGAATNCTATLTVSGRFYLGTARIQGTQSFSMFSFAGWGDSCINSPSCTAIGTYSPGSGATATGFNSVPVYVPACAGVLSSTQTVQLPKVSTSSFLGNPNPVAKTGFQISLASCLTKPNNGEAGNVGYDAHIVWSFLSCVNSNIICSTGSSNVYVQILRSDSITPITLQQDDDIHVLTSGTNVFQYYAAYVNPSGGTVTPGSVGATATLTVYYE